MTVWGVVRPSAMNSRCMVALSEAQRTFSMGSRTSAPRARTARWRAWNSGRRPDRAVDKEADIDRPGLQRPKGARNVGRPHLEGREAHLAGGSFDEPDEIAVEFPIGGDGEVDGLHARVRLLYLRRGRGRAVSSLRRERDRAGHYAGSRPRPGPRGLDRERRRGWRPPERSPGERFDKDSPPEGKRP